MPKLSIVTPAYNTAEFISDYIKSLQDQDFQDWELIVVDDGSSDGTYDKVIEMQNKDPRIFAVKEPKNVGASAARNHGAISATGEYIMFPASDGKFYPGALTKLLKPMEEDPTIDFVYGGYRFYNPKTKQEQPFIAEEFDPYFLKQYNYIDGTFPMRKKLFDKTDGFDIHCKSLNDWEFWLNAVIKCKAKGHWIPEMFFDTRFPHKGGLSWDSSHNWADRVDYIKKKYNIGYKDICVTSLGAPHHGKKIAKVLNADFKPFPLMKLDKSKYKMIYSIGFYPNILEQQAMALSYPPVFDDDGNIKEDSKPFKGKKIAHWIGSDIWQLMNMIFVEGIRFKGLLNDKESITKNIVEFEKTKEEMEYMGVKELDMFPLPVLDPVEVTPLPEKFTVAVYAPKVNREVYNFNFMLSLAQALPDVDFKFFGAVEEQGTIGNIEYMGYLDKEGMNKLIKETSCIIRLTVHDGFPLSLAEWIIAGRHAIFQIKQPYMEHLQIVGNEATDLSHAVDLVRKLKKYPLNKLGSLYYKKLCDPVEYKEKIYSYLEDKNETKKSETIKKTV